MLLLQIEFLELPLILPVATLITAAIGESVTLRCHASGYPIPIYQWMRNGSSLSLSRYVQLSSGALMIESVERSDGGNYTCTARNSAGTDSQIWTVAIQGFMIIFACK